MMDIKANDIKYKIGEKQILNKVSLNVSNKEMHTILGPNGCGKTTMLKTIYNLIKPDEGIIYLNGTKMIEIKHKERAKGLAVVAQFNNLNFDTTCFEVVMLGRTPHKKLLERDNQKDYDIVENALALVGMLEKKDQLYLSLSGGEKQRVVLARAIAQAPKLLILDEPTNHLDIKYQLEILKIAKNLKINVLAVLHDISLAAKFSDYIYLMKNGVIIEEGTPKEVITEENIKKVYEVDCDVIHHKNEVLISYK